MNIKVYLFSQLSSDTLYAILELRERVFVVEQQSIYQDLDGLDQASVHLCLLDGDLSKLRGYTRLRYDPPSATSFIERVVVDPDWRGRGLAKRLIKTCIDKVIQDAKSHTIVLSAQLNALNFYTKFGFEAEGEVYDDGGIDHQKMVKRL